MARFREYGTNFIIFKEGRKLEDRETTRSCAGLTSIIYSVALEKAKPNIEHKTPH